MSIQAQSGTMHRADDAALEATTMRKVTLRLLPFMMLLMVINFLDRTNLGFAALTMNKDLGLTPAVFGFGAGVFAIGYILFEIPSNVIMHNVGANRWIARIMVTWGIVAMGMAFVRGPNSFYFARFMLGLAEAGFVPGLTMYIIYWFPLRQRAQLTGTWIAAVPLAAVIGGPLSGLLLQLDGVGHLAGWQWLFLLEGIPAVILGIVTYFYLTPNPERAAWLTADEKAWLKRTLDAEATGVGRQPQHGATLLAALANWRVLVLGLLYIGMNMGMYGVNLWLPTIIKSLGSLTNMQVTLLIVLPWAIAGILAILWGRYSDRSGERYINLVLPLILGAAGFLASAVVSGSIVLSMTCLTIATLGVMASYTVFWVIPGTFLSGVAAAGGIALINTLGNTGGFFGPFAIGWIRQSTGSFSYALVVLAAALVVSALVCLLIRPHRRVIGSVASMTSAE